MIFNTLSLTPQISTISQQIIVLIIVILLPSLRLLWKLSIDIMLEPKKNSCHQGLTSRPRAWHTNVLKLSVKTTWLTRRPCKLQGVSQIRFTIPGRFIVQLVSTLTGLDLTKQENWLVFSHNYSTESELIKMETKPTVILLSTVRVLWISKLVWGTDKELNRANGLRQ